MEKREIDHVLRVQKRQYLKLKVVRQITRWYAPDIT